MLQPERPLAGRRRGLSRLLSLRSILGCRDRRRTLIRWRVGGGDDADVLLIDPMSLSWIGVARL